MWEQGCARPRRADRDPYRKRLRATAAVTGRSGGERPSVARQAPTGIVTLLFTDIEGSSELAERHRGRFEAVRAEHYRLLREAVARWQGVEVETAGDSLFAAFE